MKLVIAPPEESHRKSRIFACELLGYATVSDTVWEPAGQDTIRPVWIALGGSEGEVTPFVANLRSGRKAERPASGYSRRQAGDRFEILKSVPYVWSTHRVPTTSGVELLTFGCVADLCGFQGSGVDPWGVRFACVTPDWYAQESPFPPADAARAVAAVTAIGLPDQWHGRIAGRLAHIARTMAMLNERTAFPLIPDLAFSVRAYANLLRGGVLGENRVTWPKYGDWRSVIQHGALADRMATTVIVGAHGVIDSLLAQTVKEYLHHGPN